MLILSVDTSATPASVCLYDDRVIAEYYIHTRLTHSQTLMSMIESMLSVTGVSIEEIDRFAVNNGPGSFTGVRIGVSAVKGMAYAANKPCVPISTLLSMGYNMLGRDCIVCACMDARRSQVYNALFRVSGDQVSRLTPDRAIAIDELIAELVGIQESVVLVGDGAPLVFDQAGQLQHVSLAPPHLRFQRASSAAMASMDGEPICASALMPSYLRLSQAERERKAREDKE